MSTEKNVAFVQDMYAAFARGDIAYVLAQIPDDCAEFGVIAAGPSAAPWHIESRGKAGAAKYFEALGGAVEYLAFEPRDYAATGDHVYVTIYHRMKVRATGEVMELKETVHHIQFKQGRLARWVCTEDTKASHEVLARSRKAL
jgi:ketosteroid isomerase-like protein